jgi:hypothetical protein
MQSFFKELGDTVLQQWKRENFSLEKFPQIATAALDKRPPARHVDLPALLREFLFSEDQPPQTDSEFGEPEIVAYSHPRFYIQLLFWLDGTTAIHQHEFSGAFHVMHGSSIHAHYRFDNAKAVTPYLRVGDVRLKEIELLEAGRTMPIISGQSDIHSLFHLDSPSVTVVVRTQHDPGTGPQFNYLPPGVAFDPHFSDKLTMRRKQVLDVLEQTGDDGYADLVKAMISDLDFERGFSILHHCMPHLDRLDQWQPVMRAFEKKHHGLAKGVAATLQEDARRSYIKGLRGTIVDPEQRFFLALLMNAPTRADLLELVKQRLPKQRPREVVRQWVESLMEVSEAGLTILDAVFPDSIDVELDAQPTAFVAAFEYFMSGSKKRPAALQVSASDIESLRSAFAGSALGILTK